MSKLLIRALKTSIPPAILMIAGKLFGIIAVSALYGLNLSIGNEVDGLFSTQIFFPDEKSTLMVNSFSDLAMLLVLFVPTTYLIVKTALFQSSLTNPKTIVKIVKFNALSWITKDNTTFLTIFVWSAFTIVASALVIANSLQGHSYTYMGYLAVALALFTALGSLKTFEVEINKVYPNSKKYY